MNRAFVSATHDAPECKPGPTLAGLGTRVTIRRDIVMSDVWIVGEEEADPSKGRIAWTAPLARALEGARQGDVVEIAAGAGVEEVLVLAVHIGEH